ncbi:hypothetical protein CMV_030249 [Castanea mollissima]|uniref:Uncharacterized protein n=1 Tax=Castanea mollissima TaxID=60419 RepID=A0A8J4Q8G9_9ROSI|nr:hypothetical protein CMV_030249 [Castanea mollissima]
MPKGLFGMDLHLYSPLPPSPAIKIQIGGPFLVMEFSTSLARRDPIILKINLRQCSSKNLIESRRCLG